MNKRNYQRELEAVIDSCRRNGVRPRLLIHSCCAPCSSYVLEYLSRYFDITMFFYNPNMDSKAEYDKRSRELVRFIGELNEEHCEESNYCPPDFVIVDYDPGEFERIAAGHEQDPERGERCHRCYELRLRRTAEYMADFNAACVQNGERPFDYFTTSLSISPLKNAEALNDIAERLADEYGLKSLPSDFKKKEGYKRSIELSAQHGLYRQNYCGCRFSKAAADAALRVRNDLDKNNIKPGEE